MSKQRLRRWLSSKECTCNAGDRLDPWIGKIPLEKEMATHSRILSWEIPRTEEPGKLQSMGSQIHVHTDTPTQNYTDPSTESLVVQSLSHLQLCDPMDCSLSGSSVLHCLP